MEELNTDAAKQLQSFIKSAADKVSDTVQMDTAIRLIMEDLKEKFIGRVNIKSIISHLELMLAKFGRGTK